MDLVTMIQLVLTKNKGVAKGIAKGVAHYFDAT
jgi:phage shock protein PspC (stress-responsive transcriptional regulator)